MSTVRRVRPVYDGEAGDEPMALGHGRVAIVTASVGAGHDTAAYGLARRLRAAGYQVDVHNFLHCLPRPFGRILQRGYVNELRYAPVTWAWTHDASDRRVVATPLSRGMFRLAAKRLLDAIGDEPDVVVATYHLAAQALGRLRSTGRLDVPAITFLTDLSVHRLWVADGIDAHLALHKIAAAEAKRLGARCVRTCNPAVPATFRPATSSAEKRACRDRFGLPADRPVALLVTGAEGFGDVEQTARELLDTGLVLPVVACGRNTDLRDKLDASGLDVRALGWVDAMPELLRASDVVVQNAGGRSSLEALATRVPTLTYRCIPGHGKTNAAVLERAGLARWVQEPAQLRPALLRALAGDASGLRTPRLPTADPVKIISDVVAAHDTVRNRRLAQLSA